jgi:hypothetical protein
LDATPANTGQFKSAVLTLRNWLETALVGLEAPSYIADKAPNGAIRQETELGPGPLKQGHGTAAEAGFHEGFAGKRQE